MLSLLTPKEVKDLELGNAIFELLKYTAVNPSPSYDCYKHIKKQI